MQQETLRLKAMLPFFVALSQPLLTQHRRRLQNCSAVLGNGLI